MILLPKVEEQTILFFSVIKWVVLATLAGAVVGASTTLFLRLLYGSIAFAGQYPYYFFALPLALGASAYLIHRFAPQAEGHGTEKVIEAVHRHSGRLPFIVAPVKLLATIVTIASGGSAGREGPAAQIGAGLMSTFADLVKFDPHDHKKLVICGISAGFASVFGTPIAGAIFGVEVLFVGGIMYEVLLPSFVAGIVSFEVSSRLGIVHLYTPLSQLPSLDGGSFLTVILAGIFFGLCSWFFIEVLEGFHAFGQRLKVSLPIKAIFAGTVLIVLALAVSTDYLGLSTKLLESALHGENVPWYSFIMKAVFTAITLAAGGSGGVLTAIFVIGSTSGNLFAHWVGANAVLFAAIGFVSLLAGTSNTPIAASIMALELFGPSIAPFAAISCIISFLITGHRSVYPSQEFVMTKSASIEVRKSTSGRGVDSYASIRNPRFARAYASATYFLRSRMDHFFKGKNR